MVVKRDLVETAGHQIEKSEDVEMKPPLLQLQYFHWKLQAPRGMDMLPSTQLVHVGLLEVVTYNKVHNS